jgi:hypothetical protein
MPPLTRWMVKTALAYLVLALGTGVLTALGQAGILTWVPGGLAPSTIHLFVVGWVTLLIFGVVFWMFPKYTQSRPRRSERVGWALYVLLNAGLISRLIGETILPPGNTAGGLLVFSALLQFSAGALFVINTWGRVKEK